MQAPCAGRGGPRHTPAVVLLTLTWLRPMHGGPRRTPSVPAVRKPVYLPCPLTWLWCWAWGVSIEICIAHFGVLGRLSVGPVPAPPPQHHCVVGGLTPGERIPCSVAQGRPREQWSRPGWRESGRAAHGRGTCCGSWSETALPAA